MTVLGKFTEGKLKGHLYCTDQQEETLRMAFAYATHF